MRERSVYVIGKEPSSARRYTLFGEHLDEGRFQRRHVRGHGSILQLDIQMDRAEMREPAQLLIRLECRVLAGI